MLWERTSHIPTKLIDPTVSHGPLNTFALFLLLIFTSLATCIVYLFINTTKQNKSNNRVGTLPICRKKNENLYNMKLQGIQKEIK